MGGMNVHMKIGTLRIESHKPCSIRKTCEYQREHDHPEVKLVDNSVEQAEVQDRVDTTPFLRCEEIWGVKVTAVIVL